MYTVDFVRTMKSTGERKEIKGVMEKKEMIGRVCEKYTDKGKESEQIGITL